MRLGPTIYTPGSTVRRHAVAEDSGQLFGASFTRLDPAAMLGSERRARVAATRAARARGGFDEVFPYAALDDDESDRGFRPGHGGGLICPARWRRRALHFHEERALTLRRAGESLLIYERKHPGVYWWQRVGRRPDLAYFAVEQLAWLRAMIAGREWARDRYFTWAMERHLARGYRAALATAARRAGPPA